MVLSPTTPDIPKQVSREPGTSALRAASGLQDSEPTGEVGKAPDQARFARLMERLLPENTPESSVSEALRQEKAAKPQRKPLRDQKSDSAAQAETASWLAAGLQVKPDQRLTGAVPGAKGEKGSGQEAASVGNGVRRNGAAVSGTGRELERRRAEAAESAGTGKKPENVKAEGSDGSRTVPEKITADIAVLTADGVQPAGKPGRKDQAAKSGTEPVGPAAPQPSALHEGANLSAARVAAAEAQPVQAEAGKGRDAKTSRTEGSDNRKKAAVSSRPEPDQHSEQDGVKLDILDRRTQAVEPGSSGEDRGQAGMERYPGQENGTGALGQEPLRAADRTAAAETSAFLQSSPSLRQYLEEEGNVGIVRSAKLVLHDGDRGEIRMQLKPEHLGSVRISLSMNEDHIAGRIIVDNETVREAFEQDLQSLADAFAAEGLIPGNLEVTVGSNGQEGGRRQELPQPRAVLVKELERHTAPVEIMYDGYLNLIV